MEVSYFHSHEQNKHACTTLRPISMIVFSSDTLEIKSCFRYGNIKEYMNLKMILLLNFSLPRTIIYMQQHNLLILKSYRNGYFLLIITLTV